MLRNGFTLHDSATAAAPAAAILHGVNQAWGFVPNLHRVLAESTAVLEAYARLWRIAEKTECTYCMAGHTNRSKMAHVPTDVIATVRNGSAIGDAKLEALRAFAASLTRRRGIVSEPEVAAFKAAGYTNQAGLDLLVLAATKLISNYTNHIAQTSNDGFMRGAEWSVPGRLQWAA